MFVLGAGVGGGLVGIASLFAAGLVSWASPLVKMLVLSMGSLALLVYDVSVDACQLPQRRRLIPERVWYGNPAISAARFGFEHGAVFRTYITAGAPYVFVLALILLDIGAWYIVLGGAAVGIGKGLTPLQYAIAGVDGWQSHVERHSRTVERVSTIAVAGVVVWIGAYTLFL